MGHEDIEKKKEKRFHIKIDKRKITNDFDEMLLLLVHFIDEAKEGSPINNFPSSIKVFLMHDKNLTPASHGKGFFFSRKRQQTT
jgi:hypothetical protein